MTPFDKEILARTAWMEARGEGRDGLRAVIHSVNNRFTAGKWFSGKTIVETCILPEQYSCWNTSDPNRRNMARLPDDDVLLCECRDLVALLIDNDPDTTGGATHYYAISMKSPPDWTKTGEFTTQIGNHRFYKNVP